jgi:hypothetical protein
VCSLTNTTLRNRFGIEEKNSSKASRIIRDTIKAGLHSLPRRNGRQQGPQISSVVGMNAFGICLTVA